MLFQDRKYEVDNPEWLFERFGGKTQLDIALKGQKKDLKATKKQIDASFIEGLKSGALVDDKVMFKTGENRIYKQSRNDTDFIETEPVQNYFKRNNIKATETNFREIKNRNTFLTITDEFSIFDSKVYNKLKNKPDFNQDPEHIYSGIKDYRTLHIDDKHLGQFKIKELIGPSDILPNYNEGKRRAKQNKKTIKSSFDSTPIKVADKNINTNSSPKITEITTMWKGLSYLSSIGKNVLDRAFFIIDEDGVIDDDVNDINNVRKTLNNIYDENDVEALYDTKEKPISEYKQFNMIQENAKESNSPRTTRNKKNKNSTFDGKDKDKNVKNKETLDRETLFEFRKNKIEDVYLYKNPSKKQTDRYNNKKTKLQDEYDNYEGDFTRYKKK